MEWSQLVEFIEARDPAYLTTIQGVSTRDIELCEQGCSIRFPRLYRGFLAAMGVDCGKFRPFGVTQCCGFYRLVELLPAEGYPADKFYKVSFEDAPLGISGYDFFIDLERSDGHDAPLVTFEDIGDIAYQSVVETGFALGEQLMRGIFEAFELPRYPYTQTLGFYPEQASVVRQYIRRSIELLRDCKLAPTTPVLPRVVGLGDAHSCALVESREVVEGIRITLGSKDRKHLAVLAERLRELFPE